MQVYGDAGRMVRDGSAEPRRIQIGAVVVLGPA